jgi:aspartyl-tRNA(Asn)/glutamyl-tRNA(Gln) amidotransferase subunit C
MALSQETLKYVADLSRIELNPQELEKLSLQLQTILGFIDQLGQANITGIEPTSHILPLSNILREDDPKASLPIEKTLANAPQKKDNFFVVPKVIE